MQSNRLRRQIRHGATATAVALALACGWTAAASAATCSVSSPGVSFSDYNPLDAVARDGVGNIAVSCDATASYTIALGQGTGTYGARTMTNGSSQLQYNLYTSPQRLTVWGDGTGSTATVSDTASGGNYTVYGRISEQQNVTTGTYSDTMVITVTY